MSGGGNQGNSGKPKVDEKQALFEQIKSDPRLQEALKIPESDATKAEIRAFAKQLQLLISVYDRAPKAEEYTFKNEQMTSEAFITFAKKALDGFNAAYKGPTPDLVIGGEVPPFTFTGGPDTGNPLTFKQQPTPPNTSPRSTELPPTPPPRAPQDVKKKSNVTIGTRELRAKNASENQSSQGNSAQQNNATPPVRTASTGQQQNERKTPQQLMEHISQLNKKIDHTKKVLEQYDAGIKKFVDEKGFKKAAEILIKFNNDLVKPPKDLTDQKKINQRKTEIFALLGTRNHLLKQEPPNTTLIDQNTKSLCEINKCDKDDLEDRDEQWKKITANEKEAAKQKIEIKDPSDNTKVIAIDQQEANKLRMELAKLEEEKALSEKQAARQTGEREPVQNSTRCTDPNPEPFDFTATKDVLKEFKSSYPKGYPCKEDASPGAVQYTSTAPPPPPTHTTTVTKDGVSTTSQDEAVLRQNARLYLQLAKENGRGVTDDDVKISGKNTERLWEIFRDERKKMELEEQASFKDANSSKPASFKDASRPSTSSTDDKKPTSPKTPPVKGQVGNTEDKKDMKDKDPDTDKDNDADKPKTPRPGGGG